MSDSNAKNTVSCSWGVGSVLAAGLSYHVNGSILWAILHFLCGWLYCGWYLLMHTGFLNYLDKLGK
jgi:hypothetical protein